MKPIEDYVRGLGLDAYVVGGAVRDELLGLESKDADFLVPGVDIAGLRRLLEPHGRVDALDVAGRPVGLRLHPRDREVRRLVPGGIELAPPRRERSTGPGRHDFEIVVDPDARVEDDLGRRDFTVNAMARHLDDDAVVDPFGGRADLERRILRTVSPRSFAEDPLRLVRALRFVSQLGFDPDDETVRQMEDEAGSVALVSAERIGGGLAADGMGELSKLLLGASPAKALRLARDTGVLTALLPEFEPAIGFDSHSRDHRMTVDEHTFAVVQAAADAGAPLRVRLATLLHDLGKPHPGADHDAVGAEIADAALRRLRYPNDLRERVVAIVRSHPFLLGAGDALEARQLLARHGEGLAHDLLDHWDADLRGRDRSEGVEEKLERVRRFRGVVEQELASPHRLSDLAVDGADLIELGYRPGPALGRALDELLGAVVVDPGLNRRETLLDRARELLPRVIHWQAPGPYTVAFTTRVGGVSDEPYDSLNLGSRGDDPARVAENRRRACEALGLDADRLALNRQRHSPAVHRARPGVQDEPGDGLWSDEPGLPMLALSADCVPIAIAAAHGAPALAVVHAGWRGLADGVVRAAVDALPGGAKAAVVGPAIGPCCYEVGSEVSSLFDAGLTSDGRLDLWSAAELALVRAGVERVERVDLCTSCNESLFFSHRRDGLARGVQGVIGAVRG